MRKLVEHAAGAIALATLMALLIPSSVQPLTDQSMVSSVAGSSGMVVMNPTAAATSGRWKLGGDGSCVWDANDSGPNQCAPAQSDGIAARAVSRSTVF